MRFDEAVPRSGSAVGWASPPVTSRHETAALTGSREFELVKVDLSRTFPDSGGARAKYLAWLDAPSQCCGQGGLFVRRADATPGGG